MLNGYVRCIDLAEKSGISIEQSTKQEIYKFALLIREKFESNGYNGVDLNELGQLLYIYSYYDFDSEALINTLDDYYIDDEQLFNPYSYNDENPKINAYIDCSIEFMQTLMFSSDDRITEFHLDEGLVDWFNNNIENYDGDDWSNFYTILFLYYNDNEIKEKLNYTVMSDMVTAYMDEIASNVDSLQPNLSDVANLEEYVAYSNYFEMPVNYYEKGNELYSQISSYVELEYNLEDKYSVMIMSFFLRDHYAIYGSIYNDFLNSALNDIIDEHYKLYCEGKIGE
jgi:hypothetical protein